MFVGHLMLSGVVMTVAVRHRREGEETEQKQRCRQTATARQGERVFHNAVGFIGWFGLVWFGFTEKRSWFQRWTPPPDWPWAGATHPFCPCFQEFCFQAAGKHTQNLLLPTDHLASLQNESRIRGEA